MKALTLILTILIASNYKIQASQAFEESVLQSVVSVIPRHPFKKNKLLSNAKRTQAPEGTAVAVFPGGFLATNSHVLGSAKFIDIRLEDGRFIQANIIGRDPFTDIALLQVPLELPILKIAQEIKIASPVCAVGNQFGLGLSVTCGVISALHRTGTGFNPIEDFIQTDATINPGGSGGALVNGSGEMVGLVSAIFTKESDSNIGVNFAISSEMVLRVITDLRDYGRVKRGRSGIRVRSLSLEDRRSKVGALINFVKEGGAGFKGGLRPGHIITKIGNRNITKPTDVSSAFHKFRPGEAVEIEYLNPEDKLKTEIFLLP